MKQLLLYLCFSLPLIIFSQDIHWSQPYAAPIYVNPANTGFHGGLYRFGGNMRMQWNSVTVPYKTISAWADFNNFMFDKVSNDNTSVLFKNDYFGYGLIGYSDRAGDGDLTMNKIYGSVAYHLQLSKRPSVVLSVGTTVGYVQKSIQWDQLYFDDQWNGKAFTEDIQTAQRMPANNIGYFDYSIGLMMTIQTKKGNIIKGGWSRTHVNESLESFVESTNQLGVRHLYQLYGKFQLSPSLQLEQDFFFSDQKKAMEAISTTLFGYTSPSNPDVIYHQGISTRYIWDIIPVVGATIKDWRFLFSYDFNISELRPASQLRGGTELSFVKIGVIPNNKRKKMSCPYF